VIRLYIDEDSMQRALVRALRSAGFDVLTAAEAGRRGTSDAEQLAFATTEERVCYSANVGDFSALHARYLRAGRAHAGIILLPDQRMPVGEQLRRIRQLTERVAEPEMRSRLEWLALSK
jgi:hypothetical protein